MNFRKKTKTVQSVEEKSKGFFSKITSKFKIKPAQNEPQTKPKKVKEEHKETRKKTTKKQIKKIFNLKTKGLSVSDIARAVGISVELTKYYLRKGERQSLKDYKNHNKEFKEKRQNGFRYKEPKPHEPKKKVGRPKKETPKLSEKQAEKNLNQLYKSEKYPTEHQADPRYFAGSKPPHSVATEEAFDEQKRKNNINRAVVAKKLTLDRQVSEQNQKEEARKKRLREKHRTKQPKIHYDCCPSCNPKSNLSTKEYDSIVRQEAWRRHEYAEDQKKLLEKEKELDERERQQKGTVAEQAVEGTKLCKKCDGRLTYSQATRSKNMFGDYYCGDHEPNPV